VVGGVFQGTMDLGTGQVISAANGLFLARFDPTGAPLSLAQLGQAGATGLSGPALDAAGSTFFAAQADGAAFGVGPGQQEIVGKLGPSGQPAWVRAWDAQVDGRVNLDAQDDLLLSGTLKTPVDFGAGVLAPVPGMVGPGATCFLARLDPQGQAIWSRSVQTAAPYTPIACLAGAAGGDAAGGVVLVGSAEIYDPADQECGCNYEGFAARLDPAGQTLWSVPVPSSGVSSIASAVAVAPDGTTFVAGAIFGEALLAALDAGGQETWRRTFPGGRGFGVALHGSEILVSGTYGEAGPEGPFDAGLGPLTAPGDSGQFLVRLDAAGHTLCAAVQKREGDAPAGGVFGGTAVAVNTSGDTLAVVTSVVPGPGLALLAMPH
jgi:outer membrane protein assembly factor BamB